VIGTIENMKASLFIILFIAIAVATGWWLGEDDPITNYPPQNETIVAFGDSLIEGVGATANNDLVSRLEAGLGRPIINLGRSGDTTAAGVARIDEVIEERPGVVIILLGGNDAIRRTPVETTKQNLTTIITELQNQGSVVVLLGVRSGLLANAYDDMYEDLAKEFGTAYVSDVLAGIFGRPNLMADTIHPNDDGYAKMSERVLPVVESVLK
jgi:acyl-CoA thioesterase-1